jgi:hypothetical protein
MAVQILLLVIGSLSLITVVVFTTPYVVERCIAFVVSSHPEIGPPLWWGYREELNERNRAVRLYRLMIFLLCLPSLAVYQIRAEARQSTRTAHAEIGQAGLQLPEPSVAWYATARTLRCFATVANAIRAFGESTAYLFQQAAPVLLILVLVVGALLATEPVSSHVRSSIAGLVADGPAEQEDYGRKTDSRPLPGGASNQAPPTSGSVSSSYALPSLPAGIPGRPVSEEQQISSQYISGVVGGLGTLAPLSESSLSSAQTLSPQPRALLIPQYSAEPRRVPEWSVDDVVSFFVFLSLGVGVVWAVLSGGGEKRRRHGTTQPV